MNWYSRFITIAQSSIPKQAYDQWLRGDFSSPEEERDLLIQAVSGTPMSLGEWSFGGEWFPAEDFKKLLERIKAIDRELGSSPSR
jgi:hypothetical protein